MLRLLALLLTFLTVAPVGAATLQGRAYVIDGDTVAIDGQRIRLSGIDAPERAQRCGDWACGKAAKAALGSLVRGAEVRCEIEGQDWYRRALATCWRAANNVQSGAINVNSWMVESGFAIAYRKYSKRYVAQEDEARARGRGIWRTGFDDPKLWRSNAKLGGPSIDEQVRGLERQLDEFRAQQQRQTQWPQEAQRCCKHCTKGKPCGNSCIAANKQCHQPPGCACGR